MLTVEQLVERIEELEELVADQQHTLAMQAGMLRDRRKFTREWAKTADDTFMRRSDLQGELL